MTIKLPSTIFCLLGLLGFTVPGVAQEQLFERLLVPGRTVSGDTGAAGRQVALSDHWAFLNLPADYDVPGFKGAVSVFSRTSNGLEFHSRLRIPGGPTSSRAGMGGVTAIGDTVAIGSPWDVYQQNGTPAFQGRFFVFRFDGATWQMEANVGHPAGEGFASSTALYSEDELLVGVPGYELPGTTLRATGAIHVYRRAADGSWTLQQELLGSDDPNLYMFGFGDSLELTEGGGITSKNWGLTVVTLDRDAGGSWSAGERVQIPPTTSTTEVYDMAYNGEWIAAGDKQGECNFMTDLPSVILMHKTPSGWQYHGLLRSASTYVGPIGTCNRTTDGFGYCLELEGDRLAVGSPFALSPGATSPMESSGRLSVFGLKNGVWEEEYDLRLRGARDAEGVGYSLDLREDTVFSGAVGWDPGNLGPHTPGAGVLFEIPRGQVTCPGVANATGQPADLQVVGNSLAAVNDVSCRVSSLPQLSFCLGLVAPQGGTPVTPPGSRGDLCLSGSIGRFIQQVGPADANGEFVWSLNAQGVPQPTGFVPLQAGTTWHFQAWYRDAINGISISNFSPSVAVNFR